MQQKSIIVLADDSSGACEMAGIALRFGMQAEVQQSFNPGSDAAVIVYNSDTRSRGLPEARHRLRAFCQQLLKQGTKFYLFKKIDSVLRGHIVEEARILQQALALEQAFLLPANPSKGRIIQNRNYLINGQLLHETPFRHDPDFPRAHAYLPYLLGGCQDIAHLEEGERPHQPGLFTMDVTRVSTLQGYLDPQAGHLYCGAADAFQAFLKKLGRAPLAPNPQVKYLTANYFVVVGGSTFQAPNQTLLDRHRDLPRLMLPANLPEDAPSWQAQALALFEQHRCLFIGAPETISPSPGTARQIETMLAQTVALLLSHTEGKRAHLLATGGATAAAVLQELGSPPLRARQELAPGVVVLETARGLQLTIKPGSYAWPDIQLKIR
jgi:DNA-directed RNA polymerase subunit K/omega